MSTPAHRPQRRATPTSPNRRSARAAATSAAAQRPPAARRRRPAGKQSSRSTPPRAAIRRRRSPARRTAPTSWMRYNPATGLNIQISPQQLKWLIAMVSAALAALGRYMGMY